jgi:hypothetical protein
MHSQAFRGQKLETSFNSIPSCGSVLVAGVDVTVAELNPYLLGALAVLATLPCLQSEWPDAMISGCAAPVIDSSHRDGPARLIDNTALIPPIVAPVANAAPSVFCIRR